MDPTAALEGTVISHYRVLSRLGAGGMAEVYLAKDTKLDRTVALKILPSDLVSSQDRMGRFLQEAKTASALNHPNIITIYEIGQAGSVFFIATEFIDGETLRRHLNQASLTIPETLEIVIQVASAITAAHDAGVVHRDIKPENLMVRRDGIVKVLDFGLAKLTNAWTSSVDREAQTLTLVETVPGTVLGTTAYMSPEQARGRSVDERTDIWSIGILLYEMITGRTPFEQETPSDVIAAILRAEPAPPSNFAPEAPAELDRIVAKALEKNQDERYQGVKDFLVDLRQLRKKLEFQTELQSFHSSKADATSYLNDYSDTNITTTGAATQGRTTAIHSTQTTSSAEYIVSSIRRYKSYALPALALSAIVIIALGYALYRIVSRNRAPVLQAVNATRFTATGKAVHTAISPDGQYVAHISEEAGQQGIWIGQVAAASQVQILPPAAAHFRGLNFSHDGQFIYFVAADSDNAKGALFQIPVLGGPSRKLLEDIQSPITLSPDGKQLAFLRALSLQENALIVANVDGKELRTLAKHSSPDFFSTMAAAWSPEGNVIACVYQNTTGGYYESVVGVRVTDGTEAEITPQHWWQVGQVSWLADGKGLIASATEEAGSMPQLWYLPYKGGSAKRITNDLNGYIDVSLTADSKTLASVRSDRLVNIWLATQADPGNARQITSGTERDDGMRGISWTTDGRIVYRSVAGGEPNVWIMRADGSGQRQLTLETNQNFDPVVSPDGRLIVWGSKSTGNTNLWRMDIDGGNAKQLTMGAGDYFPDYSPDGKWILYTAYDPISSFWSVWKIAADGGSPVRITDKESALPSVSPDGKVFACNYEDVAGAGYKIAIIALEGGQPTRMFDIPGSFGRTIHWTSDGRALTYIDSRAGVSNIWLQTLAGDRPKQLTSFRDQQIFGFAWSRDGKQLAISRGVVNSDVMLLKNFRP
ncbi:MAG: protein kinase [Acidobacteriota bacterium]